MSLHPSSGNELTLRAGEASATGFPSPAGTFLSALNGRKVPAAVVLASGGVLAIKLASNGSATVMSAGLRARLSVEYGLLGGGRLALFDKLNGLELDEVQRAFSVVQLA